VVIFLFQPPLFSACYPSTCLAWPVVSARLAVLNHGSRSNKLVVFRPCRPLHQEELDQK
jgi:hypothetical protein